MNRIHIKSLGFAFGLTAWLIYSTCIIVMQMASAELAFDFFNHFFHGFQAGSLIHSHLSAGEIVCGMVQTFIFFWLVGASIAAIYNTVTRTKQ
ncbi:MAG: hypothetical protein BGO69_08960 [Bacteroidetes bacterium 46-16]|nr:MAG: hypothetical protein BGO69_08960 [Bacteroidetes bacterium 46-16]